MSDLATLRTEILSFINRTEAELGTDVDNIINGVLIQTQRMHKFKFSERLVRFTYPANSDSVDITAACDGIPRDFISLQVSGTENFSVGRTIQIRNYFELINDRTNYQRKQTDYSFPVANNDLDDISTHSVFTSDVNRFVAFLVNRNLGLYPRPQTDVHCLLHLHVWLPRLVAGEDTNFLLTYAYDYLLLAALRRCHLFLKVESRYVPTANELSEAWASVVAWDGDVSNYPMMTNG